MQHADSADFSFNRREWAAAYQNTEEYAEGFWLEDVKGAFPSALNGTLFRNGPGLFKIGADCVAHPFDGHGLVASISFRNGAAFFRSRFVRTAAFEDERKAQKFLYRGTFGTQITGGWWKNLCQLSFRNPANTGLALWGGKLLALFECGHPHSLDPNDLTTNGPDYLNGTVTGGVPFSTGWRWLDQFAGLTSGQDSQKRSAGLLLRYLGIFQNLPEGSRKLGGEAVCAHPDIDPAAGRLVLFSSCFSVALLASKFSLFGWICTFYLPDFMTHLVIREYDQEFRQVSVTRRRFPGYCFLHDMSLTKDYYVFFLNPVRLRILPLLLGSRGPVQCIDWRGAPSEIHLVARQQSAENARLANERENLSEAGSKQPKLLRQPWRGKTRNAALSTRGDSAKELSQPISRSNKSQEDYAGTQAAARESVRSLEVAAEPAFVFHHTNAFQSGRKVVIDCVRYPHLPDFGQGKAQRYVDWVDPMTQPISQLWRYEVDLQSKSAASRTLGSRAIEFPAVNPLYAGMEHRFVFAAAAISPTANAPQQAILKLDTMTGEEILWGRNPHVYVGEPIFVSKKGGGEDEGWLLSVCYDAAKHSSSLVVLDAESMQTIARANLKHALPHGLHGTWSATYYGP